MFPQVSKSLLSILADLNNAVFWMVSTCPLISESSCPFINILGIESSTSITIGISVTFMFHSFVSSLARSQYLSLFSISFIFTRWFADTAKSTIQPILFFLFFFFFFFLLTITRSGHLAEIWRTVFISSSERSFWISFSRTDSGLYVYHLFGWSNLSFLHNSL